MRTLGTALVGLGPRATRQRLLAAQRRRHEDLHHDVAQEHGETERREVPSDGSHRVREIILQAPTLATPGSMLRRLSLEDTIVG